MVDIKGKKILVTGGAGFIGSHLVEKLVDLDAEVYVIDINISPKSYFAINKLKEKAKYTNLDITDRKKLLTYLNKEKFDYIFHLAAEPIVEKCYDNPFKAFETNVMGTVNVLDGARESKVKGIIVASSDKAYGKTEKAYTEESPLKGDHPYDASKSCQDLLSLAYYKTYGTPVVVTRFGNVYGEGDLHLNRIIPGICEAITKNKTLDIRSDGTFVRDYLYVKDVVDGYVFLLKNYNKVKGEAFNFSSKDTLSVLDLIKKAEKILDKRVKYKILNTAKNEIPYQHLNDRKIKKLGWKNNFNLNNSLLPVLNWYEKNN